MKNLTPIEFLKLWIRIQGFPDDNLEEEVARGTYGLVFFINAKHPNTHPPTLALKTLNPEALPLDPAQLEELQREFSKWIRLPYHRNVIAAHPFKSARVPVPDPSDPQKNHWIDIPVMPMERMEGTLADWICSEGVSVTEKLWAVAQAFNGLSHLYDNGIEGHGDLKPSNILYKNASDSFIFPSDGTLGSCPWLIKIADFGWADAWIDYGFPNKALREYIAPERLGENPTVVPEKSDVFSMGVIMAELLIGKHPASNLRQAIKSEGEWTRRVERKDWNLSDISSDAIRDLISSCLDPSPSARPTAKEAARAICLELELQGLDGMGALLERWNQENVQGLFPFISTTAEEVERLERTIGLGGVVEANSIRTLRQTLKRIKPKSLYSLGDWSQTAQVLINFLQESDGQLGKLEISQIRADARRLLDCHLAKTNGREFDEFVDGIHEKDTLPAFERFAHTLGSFCRIAEVDFETVLMCETGWSSLGIAGFAQNKASQARFEAGPVRTPFEYLDIAIREAPGQAVPYYFRALWKRERMFFSGLEGESASEICVDGIIADLETAIQLDPKWREPEGLLQMIRKDF